MRRQARFPVEAWPEFPLEWIVDVGPSGGGTSGGTRRQATVTCRGEIVTNPGTCVAKCVAMRPYQVAGETPADHERPGTSQEIHHANVTVFPSSPIMKWERRRRIDHRNEEEGREGQREEGGRRTGGRRKFARERVYTDGKWRGSGSTGGGVLRDMAATASVMLSQKIMSKGWCRRYAICCAPYKRTVTG